MAGKVEIRWKSQGAQQVMSNFDTLTKKEQKVIVEGSKIGKEFEKLKRKADQVGKGGSSAFDSITKRITANIDVMRVLQLAVRTVSNEYKRLEDRQKRVASKQSTFEQAFGSFQVNNIQDLIRNPGLEGKVRQFAMSRGAQLGEGGAAKVLQGLTDVRAATGDKFTLAQQFGAVQLAVKTALRDSSADIGSVAEANLRIQQSLGVDRTKAQNIFTAFSPMARGNVLDFAPEFGTLAAQTEARRTLEKERFGKATTTFADTLALTGFISQELGTDPEKTRTIVENLLGKLQLARKGKDPFPFKTQGALSQLGELSQSFVSGEVDDKDVRTLLTTAGLKGSQGPGLLAAVFKENARLMKNVENMMAGLTESGLLQERLGFSPQRQGQITAQASKGLVESAELVDTDSSKKAQAIEIADEIDQLTGLGPLERFGLFANKILLQTGLTSPEQFVQSVARQGKSEAQGFLGYGVDPNKDAIVQRLDELIKIQKGTQTDTGGQ